MSEEYVSYFSIENPNETDILVFSGIDKGFPKGYVITALKYNADSEETVFEYAAETALNEIEKSAAQILQELEQAEKQDYNHREYTTFEIRNYVKDLTSTAEPALEQIRDGKHPSSIPEIQKLTIQPSTKEEMTATPPHKQSGIHQFIDR